MNTGYGWGGSSSPGHPPKQNVQVTEQQIRQYERMFQPIWANIQDVPAGLSNSQANVKAYGAVGDGDSHPLSDYYDTLAEAQEGFPKASALTDEIDWAATQKCIDDNPYTWTPKGNYRINRPVIVPSSKTWYGAGLATTQLHWYGGSAGGACVQVGDTVDGETGTTSNVCLADFFITIPTDADAVAGGIGLDLRNTKWNNNFSRIRIGDNPNRLFDIGLKVGQFTFINNFYSMVVARCDIGVQIDPVSNTNFWYGGSIMHNRLGAFIRQTDTGDSFTYPSANNWPFYGTNFEHNTEEAVYGEAAGSFLFSGCRFEANSGNRAGKAQAFGTNVRSWRFSDCHFSGSDEAERALDFYNSDVLVENCREINHTLYFVSADSYRDGGVRVGRNHNETPNQTSTVAETTKEYAAKIRGSSQSIPNAAWTRVDFAVTLEDNDLFADLTNNLLSFRKGLSGMVDFYALFATNGTGQRLARLQRDRGGTITTVGDCRLDANANTNTPVQMSLPVKMQAGDKLYVEVYQDSTAALNLDYFADWSLVFGFRSTHLA